MTSLVHGKLTGVRFTRSGPVRYCAAGDLELAVHDRVLVQTDSGEAEGTVVITPQQLVHCDLAATDLPTVVRKAA
ncbi:MAG: hypothetical protein EXR48_02700 [Dehalococcoidia bacterium]|nr:hypothetical protein [Dehalococcoidia bacterium]